MSDIIKDNNETIYCESKLDNGICTNEGKYFIRGRYIKAHICCEECKNKFIRYYHLPEEKPTLVIELGKVIINNPYPDSTLR